MANAYATATLALALPLAAFLGGGLLLAELSQRQEPPKAQKPLMQRWKGYTAPEVAQYWKGFDEAGLRAEKRFIELDLVFPIAYGGALLVGLLLTWAALGRPFSPAALVGAVGWTVAADWTENLMQFRQISRYLSAGPAGLEAPWISVASAATMAKLLGLGVSILGLLALIVLLLVRGPSLAAG
jgi:hypothetical protein